MGVIVEGIPRGCQGLFTPVSLGYPLSVFNKNSTLKHWYSALYTLIYFASERYSPSVYVRVRIETLKALYSRITKFF